MGYTDAQGRPELVVNPRIKLGLAGYRTASTPEPGSEPSPPERQDPIPPAGSGPRRASTARSRPR